MSEDDKMWSRMIFWLCIFFFFFMCSCTANTPAVLAEMRLERMEKLLKFRKMHPMVREFQILRNTHQGAL